MKTAKSITITHSRSGKPSKSGKPGKSSSRASADLLRLSAPKATPVRVIKAKASKLRKTGAEIQKIGSRFSLPAKQITQMIQEGNVDKAIGHFQKQMLDAVTRIIPIAEKQYRRNPTQSYAYALNALVSQARELASDLQNTGDRQKLAATLSREILMPAFRAVAQILVDEHHSLRRRLDEKILPEERRRAMDLIDSAGATIARHAAEQYKTAVMQINEVIIR